MLKVVLDTETTGLSASFDKLIELSYIIVDTDQKSKIVKSYSSFINHPDLKYMPEGAFKVHGISIEKLRECGKSPQEVADETFKDLCRAVILGYNVSFDIGFLETFFASTGYSDMFMITDSECVMRAYNQRYKRAKQTVALERLNMPTSAVDAITKKSFPELENGRSMAHDSRWDIHATYIIAKRLGVLP